MKVLSSLLFLLIALPAYANTPGVFAGKSDSGIHFSLPMDGAEVSVKDGVEIWKPKVYSSKDKKLMYENQLPTNCIVSRKANWATFERIVCETSSNTPLSNVHYELDKKKYDAVPIEELRCIKGCNSDVPRIFRYVPNDECGGRTRVECERGHEEAICKHSDRNGKSATLVGNNINLRSAPNTSGEVVRTLASGTKVRVISQAENCTTIGTKIGRWVKVRPIDSSIQEGWLFDSYVRYE